TYYPASILGTAADNKLYQFIGVILKAIALHIPHIIFISLPLIFIFIYGKNVYVNLPGEEEESSGEAAEDVPAGEKKRAARASAGRKAKKKNPAAAAAFLFMIAACLIFHLGGLASLKLPWKGDMVPGDLYRMDINYNEQVQQLGLYTMIRLDIKHAFVPADYAQEIDVSLLASDDREEEPEKKDETEENPKFETPKEDTPKTEEPQIQEPEPEPEPDPVDRSPNVMDIDLDGLRETTKSKDVKWLCDYFSAVEPTNKNEYTGMFEGYNVVFFTVEALDTCAVSEKYTPTIYKMLNEGFVFNNFYSALHFTSTSNGECQNMLGLYPKNGKPITMVRTGVLKTDLPFTLAHQLNRLGYVSKGYHNNWDLYERSKSHPNMGYQWNFCSRGLNYEKNSSGDLKWPQQDTFMIEDSIDDYIFGDEPFNIYYLTVSGHTPYSWNWVSSKYREELADCEYSETTKAYIASVMEFDRAVEILLKKLEEAGKLENTLIVAAPDHIPYTDVETIEELMGRELGTSAAAQAINEQALDLDVYRNGLIIWSASMTEPVYVDKVCCQVDILPTVSNLLGLEYDSRLLAGTDLLSESEGMVVFSSRCWRTDKGLYNRFTQEFTPAEGVEMSEEETAEYVERTKALAGYRLDCTNKIVENNFYSLLFPGQ
ncbi:MAG: sulfatase-like hydrolase/transferase, partial [Firmicutes bacterium]|nr:sulfatase-like hydrolase/transferase [Bacillota bacterium]